MDTAKLNDWLTVVTNIGVIVGLGLLVFEISQTNEALRRDAANFEASYISNTNARWLQALGTIVGTKDVAEIWVRGGVGEQLTPVERERYEMLSENIFFTAYFQRAADKIRNPNSEALGPANLLYSYMEGKPGLEAQFDAWLETSRTFAVLGSDLEEVRRRRQN